MPGRSMSVIAALLLAGCLGDSHREARRLHYVGDELVASNPPAPRAYEAYIRARLALERTPQDLQDAREQIDRALEWEPSEPQLWTTRAEIAWLAGDFSLAQESLARALTLSPGYPPARELSARMDATTR